MTSSIGNRLGSSSGVADSRDEGRRPSGDLFRVRNAVTNTAKTEELMRTLLISAFVVGLAFPSLANQCPSLVKQIDDKRQTAQLSDADKQKVTELRNKGEAEHAAGEHAASEKTLQEALAMLN